MTPIKKRLALSLLAAAAVAAVAWPLVAQGPFPTLSLERYEYTAKFVCGNPGPRGVELANGRYATVINVLNRGPSSSISYRISEALPGLSTNGTVTSFANVPLDNSSAVQIDCPTILDELQEPIFADGFVVIRSVSELDVTGVYTAASPDGDGGRVASLDIEQVEGRLVEITLNL